MRKQFNNLDFGPIIPIGESPFGEAPDFPRAGEHPRLLFTKDMIPDMRKTLDDPDYKDLRATLDEMISDPFDGVLGIPHMHGLPDTPAGRRGVHNNDPAKLITIEAKAFAYAIWGDPEMGYAAIDAIQNYLLTLNIRFIFCDMCRDYGHIMRTVAKIYDWCYDLLTEDEKFRLFAGTINYTLAGKSGMTTGFDIGREGDHPFRNYSGTDKMECSYPPSGMSTIVGHGAEAMISRDFLSAAIAFYDEHPDWWTYIAGRLYNQYMPFRNHYYKCGMAPQGNPSYAPFRTSFDFHASYACKVLFGESPYTEGMHGIPYSLFSFELPSGQHFSEGDGVHGGYERASGAETTCALWASNIYSDPVLRAQVKYHRPSYTAASYAMCADLTPSEIFIILSDGIKPAENRHEGMLPVCYNPAPHYKMIARSRWDDPDAPVVYMKGAERWTANHDHGDAGTFQIYYKGMLSIDSGHYRIYGTMAHKNQQSTIAHNGVLIHYPEIAAASNEWYTGSQRKTITPQNLEHWLETPDFKMAEPEGASYSIKDGKTEYAYIASDISYAYNKETELDYLSRRMLSVFTDSKKNPLVFATFDSIVAKGISGRKAILLHTLPGPILEGNTVSTRNDNARLVSTYISPSKLNLTYYGEDDESFSGGADSAIWGRVEVCPELGNLRDDVLSVMYVKDLDDEDSLEISEIKTDDILGAEIMDYALLFVRDLRECPDRLTVETKTASTYMISGLSAGEWEVCVGDKTIALTVSADERFVRFDAPAGKVNISKK